MRIKNIIFAFIILLIGINSYGQNSVDKGRSFGFPKGLPYQDTTNTFALFYENNKWGFKNIQTDNVVVPAIYDQVSVFDNKIAVVEQTNHSGVITFDHKIVIPFNYKNIYVEQEYIRAKRKDLTTDYYRKNDYKFLFSIYNPHISSFHENQIGCSQTVEADLIVDNKGNTIAVITKNLKPYYELDTVFVAIEYDEIVLTKRTDSINFQILRCSPDLKNCRTFPIDTISFLTYIKVFNKNLYLIRERGQTGYFFYDSTGSKLISEKFQPLGPNLLTDYFVNERMLIKSTKSLLYGFADINGRLKIPFKYKSAFPFSEGLASYLDSTTMTFGFINVEGNIVLKPKYSLLNDLRSGFHTFGFSEGLCKIYNSSVNYSDINTIPDFKAEYISFINKKGEEVISQSSKTSIP
jgi:hypothetical protein